MAQHVTTKAQPVKTQTISERTALLAPVALALLAGLFLLYGAGFAQSATLHNAAHDARHAFAFPCH
ncbi:MAG TPA: CbtB domain-containing protein [Alphaproteobacteria bacterium]|nr:CbtB domain-containing protein [Alphaproteobacteria bacterium]